MNNKKYISILLSLCFCACLSSCGDSDSGSKSSSKSKKSSKASSSSVVDETTEANTEASTEAATEAVTDAPAEVTTEAPTEAPTEAATEKPAQSEDDKKAEAEKSAIDYLDKIDMYVLDYGVYDAKDISFAGASVNEDSIEKGTIITVGINYNTTTLSWIEKMSLVNEDGENIVNTCLSTAWDFKGENSNMYGIRRFRLPGEYKPEDIKVHFQYKNSYKTTYDKAFTGESDFEEFSKNAYWTENLSMCSADSAEIADATAEKHPFIYKINGRHCFVDKTYGTSTGSGNGSEGNYLYQHRGFNIIPLEGDMTAPLSKEDVELTPGNYADFTSCKLNKVEAKKMLTNIDVQVICNTTQAGFEGFDELPEEKRKAKDHQISLQTSM